MRSSRGCTKFKFKKKSVFHAFKQQRKKDNYNCHDIKHKKNLCPEHEGEISIVVCFFYYCYLPSLE